MRAARAPLRAFGWAGALAVTAFTCHLASRQVAAEHAALARSQAEIASARRDMGAWQAELANRAGRAEIERWKAALPRRPRTS